MEIIMRNIVMTTSLNGDFVGQGFPWALVPLSPMHSGKFIDVYDDWHLGDGICKTW